MRKEILNRGIITHALTDEKNKIYGMIQNHTINFENELIIAHQYYWSEVYCEPGYSVLIVRKGQKLINPTTEELQKYFEQSKINLN